MIGTQYDRSSRYFIKHYLVEEPDLSEVQCCRPECKGIFAIDFRWTKEEEASDGKMSCVITCPYCSSKFLYRL